VKLHMRILWSRLRHTGLMVLLRLIGLVLAAVLTAAVPVFVSASMEQTFQNEIKTTPGALNIGLAWMSPDADDHSAGLAQLDRYLRTEFPVAAGMASTQAVAVPSTGPRPVQVLGPDGNPKPGRQYLALGMLPGFSGVQTATGRVPAEGQAEAMLLDATLTRSGYRLGDRLRVPLTSDAAAPTAVVTIVGTVRLPQTGPLAELSGVLDSAVLVGPAYWDALGVPVSQMNWAVTLPAGEAHAAHLSTLASAIRELPLRVVRILPEADVVATPAALLENSVTRMATTQRMLTILLLPVYLLVVFFVLATADVVVSSRQVEVAMLRSRGVPLHNTLGFYFSESLVLAGAAALLGLLLTVPVVRVMGLSAGFLQVVSRPPLLISITWTTVGWAAAATLAAEAVSLLPLIRSAGFTVATLGQEAATRSPVREALQVTAEASLLLVTGYVHWRLVSSGGTTEDPLHMALPALTLVGGGMVVWRGLTLVLLLVGKAAAPWLSPPLYLALSLLRSKARRYLALWLMLVVTTGLGIYGAAFARTLDRDLVAQENYRTGSDLLLKPAWESEVLSYDAEGNPTKMAYREPPYSRMQDLPGSVGSAPVQIRKAVGLSVGSRNLGKAALVGIQPQSFGRVALFLSELNPHPPDRYLNLLAQNEEAVLVSAPLAQRLSLKPGDKLKANQDDGTIELVIAAIVGYWPGRLPEDGDFVVGNLDYFQDGLGLMPYDVWVRMGQDGSLAQVADSLRERQVHLIAAVDRRSVIASGRREPLRLGLYATLSMGFVVALMVMLLSYLLGVGRMLHSRTKELGVLRAMGMSERHVALSLYTEQLLLVGSAAVVGLAVGRWTATVYVPVLRQQPGKPLLPLHTVSTAGEQFWLLVSVAAALVIGAGTVGLWLRRLSIGKALRLGEDA
jgi:putative ABC transport system permease protein